MQRLFIFILLIFSCLSVYSQSRKELEKQRNETAREIKYTNKLINETKKNRSESYNKLLLIETKIKKRKELINNIEQEIGVLNTNVELSQEIILGLEKDLENLKKEYEKVIYFAYLNRSIYDKYMFILASESINEAFKRTKYLQQYTKYRQEHVKKIFATKNEIQEKIVELGILKADKNDLLLNKKDESNTLKNEKKLKEEQITLLKSKEKDLKSKLQKQYELSQRLKRKIEIIIKEEAMKAAKKLKKSGNDFFQLTPDEQIIADIFSKNKNRLPWPTKRGVVTGYFGEHPHPIIKGVKVRNDGIDISTVEDEVVRAIYEGTVSRIFSIQGTNKTVIIRHGNYLTVYSNLKNVFVNQGDKVGIKESIGVVYTEKDSDHKSVLQFQIWKENQKLNPIDWLAGNKND